MRSNSDGSVMVQLWGTSNSYYLLVVARPLGFIAIMVEELLVYRATSESEKGRMGLGQVKYIRLAGFIL